MLEMKATEQPGIIYDVRMFCLQLLILIYKGGELFCFSDWPGSFLVLTKV